MAHLGSYDWNIVTDENVWSDELYRIYGEEPQSFNASYERFIGFVHPDDRDHVMEVHRKSYEMLLPYQTTERIVRADGTIRLLATTGEVVSDGHGTPIRIRGICIDITDRQTSAVVMPVEGLGTEMHLVLGELAHELRTPLTVITGVATTLIDADRRVRLSDSELDELRGALLRNARTLNAMIERLAETVEISETGLPIRRELTDLNAVVTDAIADLRPLLQPRDVRVEAPTQVTADVDRLRVGQLISNLVSNAAKHSPKETPIHLRIVAHDETVTIEVADEGQPIEEHVRARIFAPFQKAAKSDRGLGLGLHISRLIAVAHGGSLDLAPETPDGGNRFVVTLPLRPPIG